MHNGGDACAYAGGLVGSKPYQYKSRADLKAAATKMRAVGNHLRRDSCVRVVDWQSYESTIENRVDE